jgi:nitrogen fixation/metabolism regulation signal transduction histidine kinase
MQISLIIGRYISLNSIIKPLSRLKQTTVQVTNGNFDDVEQKSSIARNNDEVGELLIQFDDMRKMLNQRTRELESFNKHNSL